jgi:TolB-like protein/Flp pilus assembly protein TadD
VTRDEIIKKVWPGTIVEYSNVPVQIAALRRALDEGRAEGSCIQTIPGRGYRFVAPVTSAESVIADSISRSANGAGGPIATDEEPELPTAVCPIDVLSPAPKPESPPRRRRAVIASIAAGAMCLAFIGVGAMNWRSLSRWAEDPAPRLSIVVLPFANLGNNPDQQYLADAITEDLTTDLSRIPHMLVISSGTASTYRNKSVDTKQIGRELRVRYVLEGSIQGSPDRVRVNVQLVDAQGDAQVWAERFERDAGNLFSVQDEVIRQIAAGLNTQVITLEAARPTEQPEALDYILRGRAARLRPNSREAYAEAIKLFEHALTLDPRSDEAQSLLANSLVARAADGMSDSGATDIARAEALVGQALSTSPHSPFAHLVKGRVLRAQNRCEEAVPEFETALALNPNLVTPLHYLAQCKLLTGSMTEVIPLEERAIRLSPRDPAIGWWYLGIGTVHLLQSNTDEAIVWLERACSAVPAAPAVHARLAAAYALKGKRERATAELAEARRLRGEGFFSSIATIRENVNFGVPGVRALFEATYLAGLRRAGVPEE